jgi:hypothetical protein
MTHFIERIMKLLGGCNTNTNAVETGKVCAVDSLLETASESMIISVIESVKETETAIRKNLEKVEIPKLVFQSNKMDLLSNKNAFEEVDDIYADNDDVDIDIDEDDYGDANHIDTDEFDNDDNDVDDADHDNNNADIDE